MLLPQVYGPAADGKKVVFSFGVSMFNRFDYEFEYYEKYYGGEEQVREKMENCPKCDSKMSLAHYCDSNNFLLREVACCHYCDFGQRKVIYVVN